MNSNNKVCARAKLYIVNYTLYNVHIDILYEYEYVYGMRIHG